MHTVARFLTLLALLMSLIAAEHAFAQGREFAGQVVQIGGGTLVVEDRRGERASFERGTKTVVEGKSGWDALVTGDSVIVKWQLGNGPRIAYRVTVLSSGGAR
jgi:hypothetical protein